MQLASYIIDNAVLQRDKHFYVRGKANSLEKITLTIKSNKFLETKEVVADDSGEFLCDFGIFVADNEKYFLTAVSKDEEIIVKNLVFGDVYLLAGQSNMEYPVKYLDNTDEILKYSDSNIHFLSVRNSFMNEKGVEYRPCAPQEFFGKRFSWKTLENKEALLEMGGIGIMFAKFLQSDFPIGVVDVSVGGSPITNWITIDVAQSDESLSSIFTADTSNNSGEELDYFYNTGGIFNEKIYPLKNCNFAGMLWYHGESAAGLYKPGVDYGKVLCSIFNYYKKFFIDENLPIVASHIATLDYYDYRFGAANVNLSIDYACENVKNALSFAIYDIKLKWLKKDGQVVYHPIHPINKKTIAKRFALSIKSLKNNLRYETSKPIEFSYHENSVKIRFSEELRRENYVYGFVIAGSDNVYVDGDCEFLDARTLKITSKYIEKATNVAYAFFQYNNFCNVVGRNGLPIKPFKTQEGSGEDLYVPKYFTYCDFDKCPDDRYSGEFGGATNGRAVWLNGELFSSRKLKVSFDKTIKTRGKSSLKLAYQRDINSYFYFGASPNSSIFGQPFQLEKYKFITLDIFSDVQDVEFCGLFIKSAQQIYQFKPTITKLEKGKFISVDIDLSHAITAAFWERSGAIDFLRAADRIQFTFRSLTDANINIDNIAYHN